MGNSNSLLSKLILGSSKDLANMKEISLRRFVIILEVKQRKLQHRSYLHVNNDHQLILEVMRDDRALQNWICALAELANESHSSRKLAKLVEMQFPSLTNKSRKIARRLLKEAKSIAEEVAITNGFGKNEEINEDEDSINLRTTEPPRASQIAIDGLPTSTPSSCSCGEFCNICQDPYTTDTLVKHLPCGHSFHSKCIDSWLHRRCTCPLCRRELPTISRDGATLHSSSSSLQSSGNSTSQKNLCSDITLENDYMMHLH